MQRSEATFGRKRLVETSSDQATPTSFHEPINTRRGSSGWTHSNPHHHHQQSAKAEEAEQARSISHGEQRAQRPQLHGQHQQDAAEERRPLQVHPGHDGAAARARLHARAPAGHRPAQVGFHAVFGGRGAAAGDAAEDGRREEHDRGGRVHGVLAAGDGAGAAGGRQGGGDRRGPGVLRGGPALHREGRRGAQGGLPRGPRAGPPRRAPRGGGRGGPVRLRVRGRRQAQLREVPRAAAPAGARRRHHHLRQHAVGRHGGAPRRRAHVGPRPPLLRRHQGPQRQARRRPAHRGLPARHRRRRHHLPPPRVAPAGMSSLL